MYIFKPITQKRYEDGIKEYFGEYFKENFESVTELSQNEVLNNLARWYHTKPDDEVSYLIEVFFDKYYLENLKNTEFNGNIKVQYLKTRADLDALDISDRLDYISLVNHNKSGPVDWVIPECREIYRDYIRSCGEMKKVQLFKSNNMSITFKPEKLELVLSDKKKYKIYLDPELLI